VLLHILTLLQGRYIVFATTRIYIMIYEATIREET